MKLALAMTDFTEAASNWVGSDLASIVFEVVNPLTFIDPFAVSADFVRLYNLAVWKKDKLKKVLIEGF